MPLGIAGVTSRPSSIHSGPTLSPIGKRQRRSSVLVDDFRSRIANLAGKFDEFAGNLIDVVSWAPATTMTKSMIMTTKTTTTTIKGKYGDETDYDDRDKDSNNNNNNANNDNADGASFKTTPYKLQRVGKG